MIQNNYRFTISVAVTFVIHLSMVSLLNIHFWPKAAAPFSLTNELKINLVHSFKKPEPIVEQSKVVIKEGQKQARVTQNVKPLQREIAAPVLSRGGIDQETVLSVYLREVYTRVEHSKFYPRIEKRRNHEGLVKIGFIILKDGSIKKPVILKKSRYRQLNAAALKTIQTAAPFQPIPAELKEDKLPVNIEIVYEIK